MEAFKKTPVVRWLLSHKPLLAITGIVVTFGVFGVYLMNHPSVLQNLTSISPLVLSVLLILYCLVVVTNAAITYIIVSLCSKRISAKNSLLLTTYSTIINFFGPLQSGPSTRAVYLKNKIGLRIRDFTYVTILYYAAFAVINGSLLFMTAVPIITALGITVGFLLVVVTANKIRSWRPKFVATIYGITLIQIILMSTIYYIELLTVHTSVTFFQALTYGASANLSMFVSITPGAIGIREAFLAFAQSLHHVPFASIVTAGILDRAFYVAFLLILLIVSTGFHVKQLLFGKKSA